MSDQLTDEAVKLLLSVPVADFDEDGQLVQTLARDLLEARAQLADAKAAQAMVVERAADMIEDNVRHAKELGREIWAMPDLRALAPASGVEALAALRAERDAAREVADFVSMGNTGLNQQLSEECGRREKAIADRDRLAAANAALEAQVARLVKWRDDPESNEAWCAGNDYALTRLCKVLGVDPDKVSWDGSDGSLDEEADALIRRILHANDDEEGLAEVQADARREGGEWKGPGEAPHRYSPDPMAMGDCCICGHTRKAHE